MRTSPWAFLTGAALAGCHASAPPRVVPPASAAAPVLPAAPVVAAAPAPATPCRAADPITPPERDATERPPPPAPTAPALVRACDALVAATRRRVLPLLRPANEYNVDELLGPLTRCYAADAGAWAFAVEGATRQRPDEVTGRPVALVVRPVFLAPDGTVHRAGATHGLAASTQSFFHTVTINQVGVFDWDGDGTGELYFHESHYAHESGPETARQERWWTYTARDGRPGEFVATAARAARIEDVDGDRRPDLVMRSPWVVTGECGLAGMDSPGPLPLLHSLPDGSFTADDAVARGYTAFQCAVRPDAIIVAAPDGGERAAQDEPGYRVACARWWGRGADEVAAEITRTYPVTPEGAEDPLPCAPRAELLRVARIDPPEAGRLRCASER